MKILQYVLAFLNGINKRSDEVHKQAKPRIERQLDFVADWVDIHIDRIRGKKLPFSLKELQRHCYIIAQSGSGKSELIKYFFHELQRTSQNKEQRTLILLEPHGDLAKEIKSFALNHQSDRLIYIDPYLDPKHTPTINPLYVSDRSEHNIDVVSQELVRTFKEVISNSRFSDNMNAILKPCISTLLRAGNANLLDLQRFMDDNNNQDLVELGKKSPLQHHRTFFENGFYNSLYSSTKQSLYLKIQSLLSSNTLYQLFVGKNTVDLAEAVNSGKIILFNLSKGEMGEEASEAFGKFMIATLQSVIFKRAHEEPKYRKPTYLFIDEFQNYVSPSIATMLSECRKYGLHLTLSHQFLNQVNQSMTDNILSNTAVKIAGENDYKSHGAMSKSLKVSMDDLEYLPKYYFFIKNGKQKAKRYKAPKKLATSKKGYLTKEQEKELNKTLIKNYYRPKGKAEPTPTKEPDYEQQDYAPASKFGGNT